MTAVSALAYLGIIFCVAVICGGVALSPMSRGWPSFQQAFFSIPVSGAFFFIPPGSLPPFCNIPWGGGAFLFLIAGSLAMERRNRAVMSFFAICITMTAFAWYFYQRGVPGNFANLGTFAAMPVWSIASPSAMAGVFFLAAGFAFAAKSFSPDPAGHGSWTDTLRYLAICALFVILFLPWNCAPIAHWPDMAVAGVDFMLFWLKTATVCFGFRHIRSFRHQGGAALLCCGIGGGILVMGA